MKVNVTPGVSGVYPGDGCDPEASESDSNEKSKDLLMVGADLMSVSIDEILTNFVEHNDVCFLYMNTDYRWLAKTQSVSKINQLRQTCHYVD